MACRNRASRTLPSARCLLRLRLPQPGYHRLGVFSHSAMTLSPQYWNNSDSQAHSVRSYRATVGVNAPTG